MSTGAVSGSEWERDARVKAAAKAMAKRFAMVNAPNRTNLGWKDYVKDAEVALAAADAVYVPAQEQTPTKEDFAKWSRAWSDTCNTILEMLGLPGHGSPQEMIAQVDYYLQLRTPAESDSLSLLKVTEKQHGTPAALEDAAEEIERQARIIDALKQQVKTGSECLARLQEYRVKAQDERDAARAHVEAQKSVIQAALDWWSNKRPVTWSNADHAEHPTVNCHGSNSEKRLAEAISAFALAPQDQQRVAHTADGDPRG